MPVGQWYRLPSAWAYRGVTKAPPRVAAALSPAHSTPFGKWCVLWAFPWGLLIWWFSGFSWYISSNTPTCLAFWPRGILAFLPLSLDHHLPTLLGAIPIECSNHIQGSLPSKVPPSLAPGSTYLVKYLRHRFHMDLSASCRNWLAVSQAPLWSGLPLSLGPECPQLSYVATLPHVLVAREQFLERVRVVLQEDASTLLSRSGGAGPLHVVTNLSAGSQSLGKSWDSRFREHQPICSYPMYQVPIHSNQGSDLGNGRSSWIRSLAFYRVLLFFRATSWDKTEVSSQEIRVSSVFPRGPSIFHT